MREGYPDLPRYLPMYVGVAAAGFCAVGSLWTGTMGTALGTVCAGDGPWSEKFIDVGFCGNETGTVTKAASRKEKSDINVFYMK